LEQLCSAWLAAGGSSGKLENITTIKTIIKTMERLFSDRSFFLAGPRSFQPETPLASVVIFNPSY
jgi:hypothetical protein